jgi:hypothetical protein
MTQDQVKEKANGQTDRIPREQFFVEQRGYGAAADSADYSRDIRKCDYLSLTPQRPVRHPTNDQTETKGSNNFDVHEPSPPTCNEVRASCAAMSPGAPSYKSSINKHNNSPSVGIFERLPQPFSVGDLVQAWSAPFARLHQLDHVGTGHAGAARVQGD